MEMVDQSVSPEI